MKLRNKHTMDTMSDKLILEKVLWRSSVHLSGWRCDPVVSNTTSNTKNSKCPTYDELVDDVWKMRKDVQLWNKRWLRKISCLLLQVHHRDNQKMIHPTVIHQPTPVLESIMVRILMSLIIWNEYSRMFSIFIILIAIYN